MAVPFKNATLFCNQRKHMSRSAKIGRSDIFRYTHPGGQSSFLCGYAGRSIFIINRYGKSRLVIIRIICYHRIKHKLLCNFPAHRCTDQSFRISSKEIHILRCCTFCGTDEISLIFPVLIVCDQNDFSFLQRLYGFFYIFKIHRNSSF